MLFRHANLTLTNSHSLFIFTLMTNSNMHKHTHTPTHPTRAIQDEYNIKTLPLYFGCCWVQINERQSLNRCSLKIKSSRSYPIQVQVWLKFSKFSWVRLFYKKGLMLHITKVSIFKVLCSNNDQQDRKWLFWRLLKLKNAKNFERIDNIFVYYLFDLAL